MDPKINYADTQKAVGYVTRELATQKDYDRVGFRAGLEVHQQLKTRKKLFCNCPSGVYNRKGDYDAEIIRHMRPTLSELGEYDGTALMEFKTRKTIVYQIKNQTACTYDIDDTPPFPLNREALDIALEIAHLCKLNIVGEVHIIRKQYLDGSIPTGFQRTAILGVEGEIQLQNKKIRLIQLSLEEDSCREISDIGHVRVYQTDRLGMPLIETVTYPDFSNPDEVREGAEYIRFLNRSTGKVNVGIGAGREDVNVSCRGGTRVEIKGVAHNQWIPELTHNEVFRQWSLLRIRDLLLDRIKDIDKWTVKSTPVDPEKLAPDFPEDQGEWEAGSHAVVVNLPQFQGILSHFTQPGKMFADELSDRLKVIACIEKPNMAHSEEWEPEACGGLWQGLKKLLDAQDRDAQLLIWGPEADIPTALETIEERCRLAFEGVPRESRKSLANGTTLFERVLPGPNRMYPDTDSVPIPLEDAYIEEIRGRLPMDVSDMVSQMLTWGIPSDTYAYILRNNLFPLIRRAAADLRIAPAFLGALFGHRLKYVEGQFARSPDFRYERISDLLGFLQMQRIDLAIAGELLPELYQHPQMDPLSVLTSVNFKRIPESQVLETIPFLEKIADQAGVTNVPEARVHWIMGQLRPTALGNLGMPELYEQVADMVLGKQETSSKKAGAHE